LRDQTRNSQSNTLPNDQAVKDYTFWKIQREFNESVAKMREEEADAYKNEAMRRYQGNAQQVQGYINAI